MKARGGRREVDCGGEFVTYYDVVDRISCHPPSQPTTRKHNTHVAWILAWKKVHGCLYATLMRTVDDGIEALWSTPLLSSISYTENSRSASNF